MNDLALTEASRQMQICNSCRYCEGLCPVFPEMTKYREFNEENLHYLANLCHNCQGCYYGCQYTTPHEFNINIPEAFNAVRMQTFVSFTSPLWLSRIFTNNATIIFILTALCIALVFILAIVLSTGSLWQTLAQEESFFKVIPLWIMSGIPIFISTFVLLSIIFSMRKLWQYLPKKNKKYSIFKTLSHTISNVFSLKHLNGGKNNPGCYSYTNIRSQKFKIFHYLVLYGFVLCFIATSVASYYHYVLGLLAPYAYTSFPVVFGSIGGVSLIIGAIGMLYLKYTGIIPIKNTMYALELSFIYLLLFVALTGMLLLIFRETMWMAFWLCIHLGFVYSFFLILPYSKFMHSVYRFIAIFHYHRST